MLIPASPSLGNRYLLSLGLFEICKAGNQYKKRPRALAIAEHMLVYDRHDNNAGNYRLWCVIACSCNINIFVFKSLHLQYSYLIYLFPLENILMYLYSCFSLSHSNNT